MIPYIPGVRLRRVVLCSIYNPTIPSIQSIYYPSLPTPSNFRPCALQNPIIKKEETQKEILRQPQDIKG